MDRRGGSSRAVAREYQAGADVAGNRGPSGLLSAEPDGADLRGRREEA